MMQRAGLMVFFGFLSYTALAQAQTSPATLTPIGNDGQAVPVAQEEPSPIALTPAPEQPAPLIPSELPPSDLPPPQFPGATAPIAAPAGSEIPANAVALPAENTAPPPQQQPAETPTTTNAPTPGTGQSAENAPDPEQKQAENVSVTDEDKKQASMLGYQPSYGSWPFSIMFRSKEITDIKKVLDYYEIQKYQASKNVDEKKQEALEQVEDILKNAPTTGAPLIYPVFQLRSIVYRSPRDWSVNVNHTTYTSRDSQDKKEASELKILALNDEVADFAWIPTNPQYYVDLLQKKLLQEQNLPAESALAKPLVSVSYKNRLATHAPTPKIDDARRGVTFRLRTNQTVDLGSMEIYEGRPPNLVIPGEAKSNAAGGAEAPVAPVLPKDLEQQINPATSPEGEASNPASSAPAVNATNTQAITKEDTQGLLNGKTSPKALIEKALQQEGSR